MSCFRFPVRFFPSFLAVIAALAAAVVSGCERPADGVIDPSFTPAVLVDARLGLSGVNTDTLLSGPNPLPTDLLTVSTDVFVSAQHPSGLSAVEELRFAVRNGRTGALVGADLLRDNGAAPDSVGGDGRFGGTATFSFQRNFIGIYWIELTAESHGLTSTTLVLPFHIVRFNQAPVLSDLVAPDTVQLGTTSKLLLLSVLVTDPDGLADVQSVYFESFRPDGGQSGGTGFRFLMYDDGSDTVIFPPEGRSGDAARGDGRFTLTIELPPTAQTGTYRFEFAAVDYSLAASAVLIHSLVVVP